MLLFVSVTFNLLEFNFLQKLQGDRVSQCAIYDASKEVRRILANISKRSFLFRECRGKKGVKTIEKRGKNLLNAVKSPCYF